MTKQEFFEDACETLGLTETHFNHEDFWYESPKGYKIIDKIWWVEYGDFLKPKTIYNIYTRKQLEQIVKNLPEAIKYKKNQIIINNEFCDKNYRPINNLDSIDEEYRLILYYKV